MNTPTPADVRKALEDLLAMMQAVPASDIASIELVPLVKAARDVVTYSGALDAEIQKRAVADGELIPGVKTERARTNRRYIDAEAAAELAWGEFGKNAFSKPELLSPAQLEKAMGKKAETFLSLVTEKPEGALKASY